MATHVNAGESIECSRSFVAVRKISKNPTYINIHTIKGGSIKLFKYKSKIRAIVTITAELNPRECIICDSSKLNLSDSLEGDVIEIYTKQRMSLEVTSNFSHVHGIQGNHINDFTYAKIVLPWQFALQRQIAV